MTAQSLRRVTVLEHEVLPIVSDESLHVLDEIDESMPFPASITEQQATELLRLNEVRRGFCQRVMGGIKFSQYCGVVCFPGCVLEILPKITTHAERGIDEVNRARAALLRLLHSARHVAVVAVGAAPQQNVQAPLLDIFIEAFLTRALEQARRGLLSRYVSHTDDLTLIRGRFQAHQHVRRNLARPQLLHCAFDEFTADNPYNRAVRAALDVCRSWIQRASTQRLWWETHARYVGITSIRMTADHVAALPKERMTSRYDPLLAWCEWLLAMDSPSMSAGNKHAPGLLFDMNKLFEAHVERLEEQAVGRTRVVLTQGPRLPLAIQDGDDAFMLMPDITVWHHPVAGTDAVIDRIIDAKWKKLDPTKTYWGVDQEDIYQMMAYALRYGCDRLELVYPRPVDVCASDKLPTFEIPLAMSGHARSIQVQVKMIDLWPRIEIIERVEDIAVAR